MPTTSTTYAAGFLYALNNFNGTDIGFVARDTRPVIKGLSENEVSEFVNLIFASSAKDGYVILGNKAVVYKILDQKLVTAKELSGYENLLRNSALSIKNEQLIEDLLSSLQHRYKIEQYYKGQ